MYQAPVLLTDLWGHTSAPPRRPARKVDIFSVESDLSQYERQVVSQFILDMAEQARADRNEPAATKLSIQAERYCECGRQAMEWQCPNDHSRYFVRLFCHSRICERCARIYAKKLKDQILPILSEALAQNRRGFVLAQMTLTITSKRFGDKLPDRSGIRRLYRESAELLKLYYGKFSARRSKTGKVVARTHRQCPNCKAIVPRGRKACSCGSKVKATPVYLGAGWMAAVEVGKDNNNLHIHALTYGPIRSFQKLREDWARITGDSFGVDIRKKSLSQTVSYVLKYIAKPPQTDSYQRLAEYSSMIQGSRRFRTGGIFYGRIKRLKPEKSPCSCIYCFARLLLNGVITDYENSGCIDLHKVNREIAATPVVQKIAPVTKVSRVGLPYDLPF